MSKKNEKTNKELSKDQIYRDNVNIRVIFISMIIFIIGVIFIIVNIKVSCIPIIFSELLNAVGTSMISISLISFAWEMVARRAWLKEAREYYFETIVKPEVINTLQENLRLEMTKKLINNLAGLEIGQMLNNQFSNKVFSEKLMRHNFHYGIVLKKTEEENFYETILTIKFETKKLINPFNIRVLINNDTTNIHRNYESLFKQHFNDYYRYLMFTKLPIDKIPQPIIEVIDCKISKGDIILKPEIGDLVADKNDENMSYIEMKIKDEELKKNEDIKEGCEVNIKIKTWVDKKWPYYPIMFGYPVCNFRTSLFFVGTTPKEINIIELFTASNSFKREIIDEDIISASGTLDGLILPDSGLVYVWTDKEAPLPDIEPS